MSELRVKNWDGRRSTGVFVPGLVRVGDTKVSGYVLSKVLHKTSSTREPINPREWRSVIQARYLH